MAPMGVPELELRVTISPKLGTGVEDELQKLIILIIWNCPSGVVIQLANSTTNNTFGEGETVNVCAELVSNGGGLRRPISLPVLLLSGTATCMYVIPLIEIALTHDTGHCSHVSRSRV